jgi:hypothetical protein
LDRSKSSGREEARKQAGEVSSCHGSMYENGCLSSEMLRREVWENSTKLPTGVKKNSNRDWTQ